MKKGSRIAVLTPLPRLSARGLGLPALAPPQGQGWQEGAVAEESCLLVLASPLCPSPGLLQAFAIISALLWALVALSFPSAFLLLLPK